MDAGDQSGLAAFASSVSDDETDETDETDDLDESNETANSRGTNGGESGSEEHTDRDTESVPERDPVTGVESDPHAIGRYLAPEDMRGGDGLCCPWCLADEAHYTDEYGGDGTACGYCEASIPVDAAWYRDGDVVCL